MPLILSRRIGETLVIDGPCTVRLLGVESKRRVQLEIVAEDSVTILRGEVVERLKSEPPTGHAPKRTLRGKWRYPRSDE